MDAASLKRLRCFRRFIDFKCVLPGHETRTDFDVTFLDEDKMIGIILDCYESLCVIQQERTDTNKEHTSMKVAKNKLFKLALARIGLGMINDDNTALTQNSNVDCLKGAFPDVFKGKDSRTWLPLHWGVLLFDTPESDAIGFTETDLKLVYSDDPMALQRHHLNSSRGHCLVVNGCGYTPAQLLCMQPVTERTMSLIRYFSDCNPGAFTVTAKYIERWDDDPDFSFSALHAVCRNGVSENAYTILSLTLSTQLTPLPLPSHLPTQQPTCELLQHLLQLDSGQTYKKSCLLGETPLEYLFRNEAYQKELLLCLLEVNSSYEVVGSGISHILAFESSFQRSLSDDSARVLEMIGCLLNANPAGSQIAIYPINTPVHTYIPTPLHPYTHAPLQRRYQ